MSTQPPPEPPVRLYKIIALSFLGLTVLLLGVVIFMTLKRATITVVAKADKRTVSLVMKVAKQPLTRDVITGAVTSSVFVWTEHFQPTGNKITAGVSKGTVTIYNKSNTAQTLVATTRFLTAAGALFHLAGRVTVPANGHVVASVYADQPGGTFDIPPAQFTIPGLSSDRQKQVYAESEVAMKGGVATIGILSETDLAAAKEAYSKKVQEAFAQTLPPAASSQQLATTLVGQSVTTNRQVGDEVSDFEVTGTSTVVVVTYDGQYLSQLLDQTASQKVDPTLEKVLSNDETPRISIASYDSKAATAELAVEQDLLVTLDANVDTLSPQHFLGKKKDDIQRYVLGLDHVASVDVRFSPSWMFSAPAVPDRITVVVKNVE